MTNDDHTFVIPAYGKSLFLETCIRSLLSQSLKSRIIITTSTPSRFIDTIANRYSIPVFVHTRSTGIASDWTFACACCQTSYITLAHQDDVYLPDYALKTLTALKNSKNGLIAFTDYNEIYQNEIRSSSMLLSVKRAILFFLFMRNKPLSHTSLKKSCLKIGSTLCCPSIMYNKEMIGTISFNTAFSINLDWYLWWELANKDGAFVYLKNKLMHHRIHSESETSKGLHTNKRQSEDKYMFEKLWPKPFAAILSKLYTLSYLSNS